MAAKKAPQAPSPDQAKYDAFTARHDEAKRKRDLVATVINECYEFCLPLRQRLYINTPIPQMDRLFDSTAPEAIQDAASHMLDDVWPTDSQPFDLKAGPEVQKGQRDAVNRALADVADDITRTINNSNFRSAAHEALLDWNIGSGFLIAEGGDAMTPLVFRSMPLTEAMPDTGPRNDVDAVFRDRKPKGRDIPLLWPGADLGEALTRKIAEHPETEMDVQEGTWRDWSERGTETWCHMVVVPDERRIILDEQHKGWGSKPFIDFHYTRVAGEAMGRGSAQLAMPDIKTCNLARQFILENAEINLAGAYQYDDDGVMNPDTVSIEPRSLIPRAPGSKGLEPLQSGANVNFAELFIKDLQGSIRRIFVGDDLGPVKSSPMSAAEVMVRTSDRAKRRAGPYTRLIVELMFQTVKAVARIRIRQGAIKLPEIDGRKIVFRPLSPITRAQAQDAVIRADRYIELMNARFGPQVTNLMVDATRYGKWLAGELGVMPSLLRTSVEQQQLTQAIGQVVAQTQDAAKSSLHRGEGAPAPGAMAKPAALQAA